LLRDAFFAPLPTYSENYRLNWKFVCSPDAVKSSYTCEKAQGVPVHLPELAVSTPSKTSPFVSVFTSSCDLHLPENDILITLVVSIPLFPLVCVVFAAEYSTPIFPNAAFAWELTCSASSCPSFTFFLDTVVFIEATKEPMEFAKASSQAFAASLVSAAKAS